MNRSFARACALAVLLALLGGPALRAGDDDEAAKEKKIRRLLKLSGEAADASKICKEQIKSPGVSPDFAKRFAAAANEKAFADMFVPIYAKHFTEDDIDGMIAFYESSAGRKLAAKRLKIQKDAMEAGRLWGARMGAKVMQDLQNNPGGDDEDDDKDDEKPAPKKEEKKPPKKVVPNEDDF